MLETPEAATRWVERCRCWTCGELVLIGAAVVRICSFEAVWAISSCAHLAITLPIAACVIHSHILINQKVWIVLVKIIRGSVLAHAEAILRVFVRIILIGGARIWHSMLHPIILQIWISLGILEIPGHLYLVITLVLSDSLSSASLLWPQGLLSGGSKLVLDLRRLLNVILVLDVLNRVFVMIFEIRLGLRIYFVVCLSTGGAHILWEIWNVQAVDVLVGNVWHLVGASVAGLIVRVHVFGLQVDNVSSRLVLLNISERAGAKLRTVSFGLQICPHVSLVGPFIVEVALGDPCSLWLQLCMLHLVLWLHILRLDESLEVLSIWYIFHSDLTNTASVLLFNTKVFNSKFIFT